MKEGLVFGKEEELVLDKVESEDSDIVDSIENDDFLLVDLLRDPNVKDEIINQLWDEHEEKIEEKINVIPKIIMDMNNHIQATAVHLLQDSLTEEEFKMAKVKFIEMRLESTKYRFDGGIVLDEDDEESVKAYHQFVLESSALFDFYIKQIQEAFIQSVKEKLKTEE